MGLFPMNVGGGGTSVPNVIFDAINSSAAGSRAFDFNTSTSYYSLLPLTFGDYNLSNTSNIITFSNNSNKKVRLVAVQSDDVVKDVIVNANSSTTFTCGVNATALGMVFET